MTMANPHNLARRYLAADGLKLSDTQKKAIMEYTDWLYAIEHPPVKQRKLICPICGEILPAHDKATHKRIFGPAYSEPRPR
jgi:ribosomal protein S27AE